MRYDQMSAFIVMDIVREAAKYPNAIHFEIGQPDLPPSDNVKAALKDIFTIEFKPQGAFYLWADVSKYTDDSYEFAKQMKFKSPLHRELISAKTARSIICVLLTRATSSICKKG